MRSRRFARVVVGLAAAFVMAALAVPSGSSGTQGRRTVRIGGHEAVAGEVLVKFRTPPASGEIEQVTDADEHHAVGRRGAHRIHSRSLDTAALIAALKDRADVEYVEPNYVLRAVETTPNDTYYASYLWGLKNTGQTVGSQKGTADADIDASDAWDITTGSTDYVVGVIDTGIAYSHADLSANAWSAPTSFTVTVGGKTITCAAGTHGYNAVKNTCDPADDHNHGSHVSGTIGAKGNNGAGVVGVNWTTRIMGLKFLDSTGSGSTSDAIEAIEFAIQAKAAFGSQANVRILSNSWGGGDASTALLQAIQAAEAANMLFVVAAGNDSANNDTTATYPANYAVDNIVSVAATDNKDQLASFSNYGATTVDLGAPGVYIASTLKSGYGYMSGTSMATPHVSGAAALVLAACGDLPVADLKAAILESVDSVTALSGKTATGGRLNVNNAIQSCHNAEPGFSLAVSPASQSVAPNGTATYTVTLTATGGYEGQPVLSVANLPSGATGTFSAWSNNVATLTVSAGTTAGSSTFTVTATDSTADLEESATATLTIANPDYTLSLSPTSLSVRRGSSGKVTVTITGSGGFAEAVALTRSTLPTGVTGTFSPTSVTGTGTSTLTITASKTATRKTTTVTVTATPASSAAKTKTFTLTIR